MKTIGRILLLVVCGLMGYYAVTTSIDCINTIKGTEWFDFEKLGETLKVIGTLGMQFITMIFALAGIVAALKGRTSLKFTLLSLILFINIVITFVNAFGNGATFDFKMILDVTLSCLLPILYVTGSFLLRF